MRFLAGWIAGLATAWAAVAIWRGLPVLDDDPAYEQSEEPPTWRSGRPGFADSVAGYPPPPHIDDAAHRIYP